MPTKKELTTTVLDELRRAQKEKWTPPKSGRVGILDFPPALALGNGKRVMATQELQRAIFDYAKLCWDNDPATKTRFKFNEFVQLVENAFAKTLAKADFDRPSADLAGEVSKEVLELVDSDIRNHKRRIELTVGCHLFEGDAAYPIRIGPVLFETREQFRQRLAANGKLSPITTRRLKAIWSGEPRGARKPSADSHTEDAILRAIGDCPVACTIETDGLSSKNVKEKGLLAARLAMAALSLMWERPSKGLELMKLLYDRQWSSRFTVTFGSGKYPGSSSSKSDFPFGHRIDDELTSYLTDHQSLLDQIGEALSSYVKPSDPVERPTVMNAIVMSLMWFHEATREPLDQIAVTKYAASMDTLVGGKGAGAIVELFSARLGCEPNDQLFKDGHTAKGVINEIYNDRRSRLIHGSSGDFSHDWAQIRSRAEVVARLCLTSSCDWLFSHKNCDSLEAMRS
ncbi:MAG: hypothetical protein AAFR70_05900 [Pseudomonadota bacterium]